MQIKHLYVSENKCLVDFEINMEIDQDRGSSTILIGDNGSGKSTMLNTVLEILMSFESGAIEKRINYDYEIEYFYKSSTIIIHKEGKIYNIKINDDFSCSGTMKTVRIKLGNAGKNILPERISYFYSGANDQALKIFRQTNANYKHDCKKQIVNYWNTLSHDTHDEYGGNFPKRRFNYCDESLVPAYLIAILCSDDYEKEKNRLKNLCYFSEIEYIFIDIDINDTLLKKLPNILEIGVINLISFIDNKFTKCFQQSFLFQRGTHFYFELHKYDLVKIDDIDGISFFNFFEKLITLLNAKVNPYVSTNVSCQDLSEGQRQLIKILGMLGVCKNEDCLVLMDEPDAHMNPKWKYELKGVIDDCLKDAVNTQAIIATHDPLVINGVDKKFIRLFESENNHTKVIAPDENTEGLGIDGLLQSEYYGLKTSYDKKTSNDFIKRQNLYSKLINGKASESEKDELRKLTEKLGALPISYNSIDFLYDDFIQIFKNSEFFAKEYLSFEEIQKRRGKIEQIISDLYKDQA